MADNALLFVTSRRVPEVSARGPQALPDTALNTTGHMKDRESDPADRTNLALKLLKTIPRLEALLKQTFASGYSRPVDGFGIHSKSRLRGMKSAAIFNFRTSLPPFEVAHFVHDVPSPPIHLRI